MATIPEALGLALQYQQSGNLQQAEKIYRQIINADGRHFEAWSRLGDVCLRSGRLDDAVTCCRQALALNPDFTAAQHTLAQALRHQGPGATTDAPSPSPPSSGERGR